MIRGLYSAASALVSGLRRQEVVANNLANVQTTGYKAEVAAGASFETVMASRIDAGGATLPQGFVRRLGTIGTGAYIAERSSFLQQGSLRETGLSLDLALDGPGFFAIGDGDRVAYTRDGHFSLDASGRLVTIDGRAALDVDGNEIVIEGGSVEVTPGGDLLVEGELVATLQIVDIDPAALRRAGDTGFVASLTTPAQATVVQGSLEESNIDIARAMTDLVAVQRSFGASRQVFLELSQNLERAVRDVGRVG